MSAGEPTPPSPAEVEREIARTRGEFGATLAVLRHKLAVRHLVEKGFDMAKDSFAGYDVMGQGLEIIRANPVPVALIGLGVAWLVAANAASEEQLAAARQRIAGLAGDIGARAGELASDVAGKVGLGGDSGSSEQPLGHTGHPVVDEAGRRGTDGWLHQMADMTQGALRSARDSSGAMLNRASAVAGDGASRITDQVTDAFNRNPLVVGAVGVMAGALLAALLPMSRTESQWLGDEELQRTAGKAGEEAIAKVRDAAARTLHTAADAVGGEADKPSQI
jgi:hypothetical protein